jgi:peroxiredoxin
LLYVRFGGEMAGDLEGATALDFTLNDTHGRAVRLSDYRGQNHVVLVFNRGFF